MTPLEAARIELLKEVRAEIEQKEAELAALEQVERGVELYISLRKSIGETARSRVPTYIQPYKSTQRSRSMAQATIALSTGKKVYVQATGLKNASSGKVLHPAAALAGLSKGDRRRVRRRLHSMGRSDLAHTSIIRPGHLIQG